MINSKQSVKLEKGFISFKNYSRQIYAPFKIYADFECILKNLDNGLLIMIFHTKETIKTIFLVVLLIKFCVLIINIAKTLFCTEEEILLTNLLDQFLMSTTIVRRL